MSRHIISKIVLRNCQNLHLKRQKNVRQTLTTETQKHFHMKHNSQGN